MQKILILILLLFGVQTLEAQQTLRKKKENDLWGFVDSSGKLMIEYQYQNVYDFYENVALVQKNDFWGFINSAGEIVVPIEFSEVQNFFECKNCKGEKR
ncbi:MAG: WG repeat-containing protein [Saprospiraceae bacterium]|nr:WG repeat-containing protein [Saprospiraceae bacterium]